MTEYLKVDREQFEAYPGEKLSDGQGREMTYRIAMGETRPLSDEERALADRFAQLFDETGLTENLEVGGVPCAIAIHRISSAIVAALDESLPQYARKALASFAKDVDKEAGNSLAWAAGAGYSGNTLRQMRTVEAEQAPSGPTP